MLNNFIFFLFFYIRIKIVKKKRIKIVKNQVERNLTRRNLVVSGRREWSDLVVKARREKKKSIFRRICLFGSVPFDRTMIQQGSEKRGSKWAQREEKIDF
jgi:hypothetical protein